MTIDEINTIRLALDTPEHNRHYVKHTTDAKMILNKEQEAINYTRCCESVKEKNTHTFEVDLNSDKLKEQHCEQMKQIHSAPARLFMYDPKTEQYIEIKP